MSKFLATLLVTASVAFAYEDHPYVQHATQAPASARYEIVLGLNATLRLDRYNGRVAQRVRGTTEKTWKELEIPGLMDVDPSAPRFQLTHMADNAETLLLLDTVTGQTWAWVVDASRSNLPLVWKQLTK